MLRAVGGGAPVSSAVILAIVASAVPVLKRLISPTCLAPSKA
jgi:hypothetical protein